MSMAIFVTDGRTFRQPTLDGDLESSTSRQNKIYVNYQGQDEWTYYCDRTILMASEDYPILVLWLQMSYEKMSEFLCVAFFFFFFWGGGLDFASTIEARLSCKDHPLAMFRNFLLPEQPFAHLTYSVRVPSTPVNWGAAEMGELPTLGPVVKSSTTELRRI